MSPLWRTDGTDAGTVLVKNINPGTADSTPEGFVPLGGKIYFTASTSTIWGLWTTDGTPAGTTQVSALEGAGAYLSFMTRAGSRLYFTNSAGTLRTSDGTTAGTYSLNVDNVLSAGSLGSSAMFLTGGPSSELRLWKTDGTQAGTVQVKGFGVPVGCFYFPPREVDGKLYFYECLTSLQGVLWKSDGTEGGTVQVQSPTRTPSFLQSLTPLGGGLFFSADDGVSGRQFLHTDGSAAGTQPVAGAVGSPVRLGNSLLYLGNGVWKMGADGSAELLASPGPSGASVQPAGGQVFFSVYGGGTFQIWKTDGTAAGTAFVAETGSSSIPVFKGSAGPVLLYRAGNDELWRSAGTPAGTFRLQAYRPILGPTPATAGNALFFASWDASGYWVLWKTDGSDAGTLPVRTFLEAPPYSNGGLAKLTPVGNRLFFTFSDTAHGEELWVSDGTEAGTHLVKDILPGSGSSTISEFSAALGDLLFFTANDGIHGLELWVSDGTDAGTHIVKDILPGAQSSGISRLVVAGGRLFFSADDGVSGLEPWTSDGTGAGSHLVKDILPGADSSLPVELTAVGSHVVFSATDGVHGGEPWVSDGTGAGTFLLQDIAPAAASSGPASFAIGASNAYFVADDGTTGAELWTVPRAALEPTFVDVHSTYWAWKFIEALVASGVSSGCGAGQYCPDALVNRAQMAVLLLAARDGAPPPPATGTRFQDVPPRLLGRPLDRRAGAGRGGRRLLGHPAPLLPEQRPDPGADGRPAARRPARDAAAGHRHPFHRRPRQLLGRPLDRAARGRRGHRRLRRRQVLPRPADHPRPNGGLPGDGAPPAPALRRRGSVSPHPRPLSRHGRGENSKEKAGSARRAPLFSRVGRRGPG